MRNVNFYPKGLKPRPPEPGIVERLTNLRRAIERDAAEIAEVSVPAVLLLCDVCKALGLTLREQQQVLGRKGTQSARKWGETPIHLARSPKRQIEK